MATGKPGIDLLFQDSDSASFLILSILSIHVLSREWNMDGQDGPDARRGK
jgi:hypothetical protein